MIDDEFDDESTVPCFFCDVPVRTGGEGYAGIFVGKRAICTGCLSELKDALDTI